jgi:predicted phosphodiesterase
MERTKTNKGPDLMLGSDFHIREDTPLCYIGDYQQEQWNSIDFISNLQKKYDCPVLHGGDLYDKWKITTLLAKKTAQHIPNKFYTIYGQHDLPQHNLDLTEKCGIDLLAEVDRLIVLKPNRYFRDTLRVDGTHWGQEPENIIQHTLGRRVLVWHKMNYKGEPPWPGCTDPTAIRLLKKYPEYDLILTGDNHKSFTQEYQGRWLVNPGSLMRMDADQENHKPRVYLWYAEDNSIVPVYIPIKQDVISREHIEQKKQRDGRIDNFVKRLNSDWKASLTFEENLEIFKKKNKVPQDIMSIIYEAIEPIKN